MSITNSRIILPNNQVLAPDARTVVIAGPCAFEGEEVVAQALEKLQLCSQTYGNPFVLKNSYYKANRSTKGAFQGIGGDDKFASLITYLAVIDKLKRENNGLMVTSDIHSEADIDPLKLKDFCNNINWDNIPNKYHKLVASFINNTAPEHYWDAVDIVQIPAFLSLQNDFLRKIGETGKIISVKKHQMSQITQAKQTLQQFAGVGNRNIIMIDRGTSSGGGLSMNEANIPYLQETLGCVGVVDITHSVKNLIGKRNVLGEMNEPNFDLMLKVLEQKPSGIFIETHPTPDSAFCDGSAQVPLHLMDFYFETIAVADQMFKGYIPDVNHPQLVDDVFKQQKSIFIPSSPYRKIDTTQLDAYQKFMENAGNTTIDLFSSLMFASSKDAEDNTQIVTSSNPKDGGYITKTMLDMPINYYIKTSADLLREMQKNKNGLNVLYISNIDFMNANLDAEDRHIAQKSLQETDIISCRTEGLKRLIENWLKENNIKKDVVVFKSPLQKDITPPSSRFNNMSNKGSKHNPFRIKASCYPIHLNGYYETLKKFLEENKDIYVEFELLTSEVRPDQKSHNVNPKIYQMLSELNSDKLKVKISHYSKAAEQKLLHSADAYLVDPDKSDNKFTNLWLNRKIKGVNRANNALASGIPVIAIGSNGFEEYKSVYTSESLAENLAHLRDDKQIIEKINIDQKYLEDNYSGQVVAEDRLQQLDGTLAVKHYTKSRVDGYNADLSLKIKEVEEYNSHLKPITPVLQAKSNISRDILRLRNGIEQLHQELTNPGSKLYHQYEKMVSAIQEASESGNKIYFVGTGKSANLAEYIEDKVSQNNINTRYYSIPDLENGDYSQLREGDVVIAFSNSGSAPMSKISEMGATGYLITHNPDNKNMDFNNVLMPYVKEFGMADRIEDFVMNSGIAPTTTILVDKLALELLTEHPALNNKNSEMELSDLAERKLSPIIQSLDKLQRDIDTNPEFIQNYIKLAESANWKQGREYSLKDSDNPLQAQLYSQVLFDYTNIEQDSRKGKNIYQEIEKLGLKQDDDIANTALIFGLVGQAATGKSAQQMFANHPSGGISVRTGRGLAIIRYMETEGAKHHEFQQKIINDTLSSKHQY